MLVKEALGGMNFHVTSAKINIFSIKKFHLIQSTRALTYKAVGNVLVKNEFAVFSISANRAIETFS